MERFVTDERAGLKYVLVGDYYLIAGNDEPEEEQPIGVWGQRHLHYLKEHRRVRYANLLTSGELNACLADIDRQAEEIFFWLAKEKADAEGITETLNASNQMERVRRMNSAETVHPHDLLIQSVRPIYIHTVSSANQVFPISFIADDTTVSLEHKCHIDRSDLKHYNA